MLPLPNICNRCHQTILHYQSTKMVPFIPRWGWDIMVHEFCEPVITAPWVKISDLRSEVDDRQGRRE